MAVDPRLSTAFAHACEVHAEQLRKGGTVPYISHLMAVSALVLEAGGTYGEAVAGLLHDTLEDGEDPEREREYIAEAFGPHVLRIVAALSDDEPGADRVKAPWRERKEAYIAHLADTDDRSTLLVCLADKFHNLQATLLDLDQHGDAVWRRFNTGPAEQLWYYAELDRVFAAGPLAGTPLQTRYAAAAAELAARVPQRTPRALTPSGREGWRVVGVDGCRAGWVAAMPGDDGEVVFEVFADIASLADAARRDGEAIIAIDVPIGLPELTAMRPCDAEARAVLKDPDRTRARFTSVFAPPDRELVALDHFEDVQAVVAKRKAVQPTARGITMQAFAIAPKIREVDAFVRGTPGATEWLVEVHPEVCFREMSGKAGGLPRKKSKEGRNMRIALLRRSLGELGVTVPESIPSIPGVARDDTIDALVALWTAMRVRSGAARRLGGQLDDLGVPMQMLL